MANKAYSLSRTKWMCKYRIVFTPKYRRKAIYGQIRSDIGEILRRLCEYKGCLLYTSDVYKRQVFGHGFLLTKGEKMSKSKGNGIKPADLVKIFGVDAYRYYFMSDVQFGHDGNISMERMVHCLLYTS